MGYLVSILLLLVFALNEFVKRRDLLCPTVVYATMWIFALSSLAVSDRFYPVSLSTLIVIIVGYLIFIFFFNFAYRYSVSTNSKRRVDTLSVDRLGMNAIFVIALAVGGFYIISMRSYFSVSGIVASITAMVSSSQDNAISGNAAVLYLSYFVRAAAWFFFSVYILKKDNEPCSLLLAQVIILILLCCLILLSSFTRNNFLLTFLPFAWIYFIGKKKSNATIAILSVGLLAGFLAVFVWFNTYKYSWQYAVGNFWEISIGSLSTYLSGGIVALDQSIGSTIHWVAFEGVNHTLAVFFNFLGNYYAGLKPALVQPFIEVGPGVITNVYTVYQWTSLDLGLLYAILWQGIYGYIYGLVYKRMKEGSLIALLMNALMAYPLLMMFFQEQYLSIAPTWTVIALMLFVVLKMSKFAPNLGKSELNQCKLTKKS